MLCTWGYVGLVYGYIAWLINNWKKNSLLVLQKVEAAKLSYLLSTFIQRFSKLFKAHCCTEFCMTHNGIIAIRSPDNLNQLIYTNS